MYIENMVEKPIVTYLKYSGFGTLKMVSFNCKIVIGNCFYGVSSLGFNVEPRGQCHPFNYLFRVIMCWALF